MSEPDGTRLQTSLEDGPLATIDRHVLVHHRVTSPYGAGWAVREAARVYRAGDVAHLVPGVGGDEVFMPRAHTRSVPYLHDFRGLALARDASTGEIFVARDDSRIDRIDPVTGASTTMLSGLGFPSVVHGLAIAYDGAARKYIVALATQLLEIDSAGTKTVLAARSGGASSSQANVASDGATVFYTDAVVPVIYRVRMSDPSRTMEALSLATGGDVRLFPRTQLSGVQLAEPRGMTVGADGTLYVADRRRNAVYAVSRDAQNAISGSSTVRPVVGDGMGGFIADRGERYPGVALSVREPLGLTTTEDGYVLVISTAGVVLFDPLAQEAEWLFLVGGIDEVRIDPTATRVSILGLTGTSLLSRLDTSHGRLVRFDVDPLSSEFAPTRTLKPLAGGGLELVDTENELVEEFDPAGRLIERKHRTGERILALQYVDATSDKIDRLIDPVGGETVFAYDGGGKLQSITDARGRVAMFTVNDLGDLVSSTQPGPETSSFVYAEHRMTDRTSQGGEHTQYAFRSDGTVQSATKPGGAVTTVDAALSHPPVYGTSGGIEYQASYVDAHGVAHTVMLDRRGQTRRDTYTIDGVTRDSVVTYEDDLFTVLSMNGHSFREDAASARRNTLLRIRSRSVNGVQEGVSTIWDSYGRPEYEHRPPDPFGGSSNNVRRWFFDANGWLMESFAGPANQTQHYERDAAGHVTRIYDASPGFNNPSPTGRETRWTYLPDGLVATRVDHGVTRTFAYDDLGGTKNELGWIDTLGRSTTHTRDPYGNITSTNDGTATTFADFDVRNRVIETRDALGNATTYGYAHAGCGCSRDDLVTSIHTPDLPVDVDWEMAYDSDRRLTSVTDPHGFTESYEYEPTGELKKTIDKLSRATTWTHDALGRAKTMIDTLGRHHGSVYTTPLSGAYSGPSLMAGSADATASSSFLTGSLRAGDYQIGHNAYPVADAPPAISLYRDATFELGFTHYFDVALRTTRKADRSAVAIDSTTIPFTAGPIWDEQSVWSPQTSMPVLQNFASTGAVTATFNRNFWFDATSQNGHRQSGEPYVSETFTRDAGGRVTQLRRRFLPETTGVSIPPDQLSNYTYRPDAASSRSPTLTGRTTSPTIRVLSCKRKSSAARARIRTAMMSWGVMTIWSSRMAMCGGSSSMMSGGSRRAATSTRAARIRIATRRNTMRWAILSSCSIRKAKTSSSTTPSIG